MRERYLLRALKRLASSEGFVFVGIPDGWLGEEIEARRAYAQAVIWGEYPEAVEKRIKGAWLDDQEKKLGIDR